MKKLFNLFLWVFNIISIILLSWAALIAIIEKL
jgi:hypothetical protein